MQAIIISIGDELTLGQTVDTNAAWLSARLIERGILTRWHQTVPDDRAAIAHAVRQAAAEADWVILTGGLGPTADDLTRQALADVLGTALETNPGALECIEQFFKTRDRPMTPGNRVQALCPVGAECLDNHCGTAPGLKLRIGRAVVVAMPGVPVEMKAMFERHVMPVLDAQTGRVILTAMLHTFGLGESQVGDQLGELMNRERNPKVGTTVSAGVVSVRVRSEFPSAGAAQAALDATLAEIRRRLGSLIYGEGMTTLPEVVGRLLTEQHCTVATAESCTAGLVGKMLTDMAGASAYYRGGWIVYANELKTVSLGVPADMIVREGAVSEPVVRRMAEEALIRSGADYALALTGIAGPDGDSSEKPVGTVWIALARRRSGGIDVRAERFIFPGIRDLVRERAAKTVLNLLRLQLIEESRRG
ncbi:MAG: competence/damage-inducible protein A [Verrucomicrobia bacterium]|nr:competence/damage-inducible protein A [Verrucomicrobiota bacterium]MBU4291445.1 competence/damage-inducible protein A [Verrucomicrobiota bacterium]MBU4428375.1 competence/damage-inducible protein A [Verrucomicrobiota bacterium]MBU4496449.1 competence/damage-inducible protein A [Verrucomicrobiota bacterium]MCG2679651.1 competence/damage-inducible protein A [Kiritimatiellia bacterium]